MSETSNTGDQGGPGADPPLIALSGTAPTRRRALAAMAVTGALGLGVVGFVGGRWSSSDSGSGSARPVAQVPPTTGTAQPTTGQPTTAQPTTAGPSAIGPTTAAPMTTVLRPGSAPMDARSSSGSSSSGSASSGSAAAGSAGSYSNGAYEEPAGTLLAARTTPDGIALTGYLQTWPGAASDPWSGQFPDWTAPGWCFPTGNLRISIVTADVVGLAGASWYAEPHGAMSVTSFAAGFVEAHPVFGVAAQVDAATTGLTLTTADGRTDAAAPTAGLVLLAVEGPIAPDFTVVATHADGTTATLSSSALASPSTSAADQRACQPPAPALPAAGEQPADAAAAEAGVRAALASYSAIGGAPAADPATYLDDTTGVAEAIAALQQIGIPRAIDPAVTSAPAATGQVDTTNGSGTVGDVGPVDVAIDHLVFVSPTEAWFRYDLATGFSTFIDRYGQARLVDGTWKLTRQTLCQDIALAGVECTPAVDQVLPPSAAEDPRYGGVVDGRPEPAIDVAPTTAVA